MKKPYQIEAQRAVKQLEAMAGDGNPAVQMVLPMAEMVGWLRKGVGELIRSEEHTSELQSLRQLVCRLLLEKNRRRCTPSRGRFAVECATSAAEPRRGSGLARSGNFFFIGRRNPRPPPFPPRRLFGS